MRLDLLDYKIIKLFYDGEDWKDRLFYIEDFDDLGVDYQTLRYHLRKLSKNQYILEQKSYPIYWEPVQVKRHRDKMDRLYAGALKGLIR